ncbi:MAG: hypothetical protein KatS3mg132_066 [Limisphaera sp.]|nr:MAG: hypothetical protein KatS3mg132_066 [Limisphaera sp.]
MQARPASAPERGHAATLVRPCAGKSRRAIAGWATGDFVPRAAWNATLGAMTSRHWELLRATSRSFYLSLRVLPARVREPIAVAYLLARTTDTVADAGTIAVANRLRLLETMRLQILGLAPPGPIPEIARGDLVGPAPEQELAEVLGGEPGRSLLPHRGGSGRGANRAGPHRGGANPGFDPIRRTRAGVRAGDGPRHSGRTRPVHLPRGRQRGRVLEPPLPPAPFSASSTGRDELADAGRAVWQRAFNWSTSCATVPRTSAWAAVTCRRRSWNLSGCVPKNCVVPPAGRASGPVTNAGAGLRWIISGLAGHIRWRSHPANGDSAWPAPGRY